jgi:phosphatidylglycerol:prolipoprotein diacylglycerol transferase
MQPLLYIFGLTIKSYNLFLLLGEAVVIIGGTWLATRRGLPGKQVLAVMISMAVAALIGTRFFHALINFPVYRDDPSLLFNLSFQGQSIYGGIILAVLTGLALSRKFGLNYWRLGDSVAPLLGVGLLVVRIGCFLNGCCFGRETSLPWGVSFPLFSPAHKYQLSKNLAGLFSSHPVHPTQVYEMIIGVVIALISFLILKKKMPDGTAILVSGIIYTVFRFVNNFLRISSPTFSASPYFYPIFYILFAGLLSVLLIKRLKDKSQFSTEI